MFGVVASHVLSLTLQSAGFCLWKTVCALISTWDLICALPVTMRFAIEIPCVKLSEEIVQFKSSQVSLGMVLMIMFD